MRDSDGSVHVGFVLRNVWLCTFAYSSAAGISGAWTAVLVVNFKPLGVEDQTAGFIGLFAILTGAVVSVFFGYITDRIRKHIKVCLFVCSPS